MENNLLSNVLSQSSFWMVNKAIAKATSNDTAIFLSDLISKREYFRSKNQLTEDEFFFNTIENIEVDTNIGRHKQTTCIKELESLNLIIVKLMGIPAKRFFKVNDEAVANLLVGKRQTSLSENGKLGCPKTATNNNKDNNNKTNNNKERVDASRPVSLQEVIDYVSLSNLSCIDVNDWWNFYDSNGWKVGGADMANWQASVRVWDSRAAKAAANPRRFKSFAEIQADENAAVLAIL